MSAPGGFRRLMRATMERQLTLAAMERLRRAYPDAPTAAPADRPGVLWTKLVLPAYARIPWDVKQKVMRSAGMTARGWTPPRREPGQPWTPPVPKKPED